MTGDGVEVTAVKEGPETQAVTPGGHSLHHNREQLGNSEIGWGKGRSCSDEREGGRAGECTGVHDDLVINGHSQDEKMDIAIFFTSAIASGAF